MVPYPSRARDPTEGGPWVSDRVTAGQQPPRLPGVWTLLRDVLSFIGGWTLIFMEVRHPEVRDSVLAFAGTIIATPGLAVGAAALTEAIIRRRSGTDEPPSQPAERVASPS